MEPSAPSELAKSSVLESASQLEEQTDRGKFNLRGVMTCL
jgi:hypothetical protein